MLAFIWPNGTLSTSESTPAIIDVGDGCELRKEYT